ncbi:MAG: hypothetical protein FWC57_03055, partial [Endomicrobia bacterium]|nr:hypothetical protein [Endomicrobiia bacterium]
DSLTFFTMIYDTAGGTITDVTSQYDTTSTTWSIEPANMATLSDATGSTTKVTPNQAGQFTLNWRYKGTYGSRTITVS